MASEKITDLTSYSNPDRSADVLPIVDVSNNQTKKITINNALNLSGAPVGTTDSQTISNKLLNNTNTIIALDGAFTLDNSSDATKRAVFSLANITTGTTRTYTLPNVTDTLVSLTATQTLTNKNLVGATLDSPNITNASITADSISGRTSAFNGQIYGINVTAAQIGGAALSPTAIKLGYAQVTTDFTTASTSAVQYTGLSVTVTIPPGGRSVKITGYCGSVTNSGSNVSSMTIWDGTVGSGTQIGQANFVGATDVAASGVVMAVVTPSLGSKTYNIGALTNAGSAVFGAVSITQPAFILVELI